MEKEEEEKAGCGRESGTKRSECGVGEQLNKNCAFLTRKDVSALLQSVAWVQKREIRSGMCACVYAYLGTVHVAS